MRARGPRDILAGLVFTVIGAVALGQVRSYPMGTLTAMGPGYFPLILSAGLVLLGLASVAKGVMVSGPPVPRDWPVLPLLVLVLGVALFGWLVTESGLLPAVFVLAVMVGYGELRRRPVQVIASAAVLAGAAALVFVRFLDMPIRAY